MYVKTFNTNGLASTLNPEEVCGPQFNKETGEHSFTHSDGWSIKGVITEDNYYWVNEFEAKHPTLGWVRGDFEDEVRASSRKAYEDFVSKHPPHNWDYGDI